MSDDKKTKPPVEPQMVTAGKESGDIRNLPLVKPVRATKSEAKIPHTIKLVRATKSKAKTPPPIKPAIKSKAKTLPPIKPAITSKAKTLPPVKPKPATQINRKQKPQ